MINSENIAYHCYYTIRNKILKDGEKIMKELVQVTLYDCVYLNGEINKITEEEKKILYQNREFIRANNEYN